MSEGNPAGATPLIIDCDPGIDDAVSIAMAVASPELDLRGITTVAGNASLSTTTRNARALLAALGSSGVPVAPGASRSLVRNPPPYPPIHGDNGLGGVRLDPPADPPAARPASALELFADVLGPAERRSVTLLALGPLTNIALLAATRPDLLERVERLIVMGGSTDRGNITPVAEFNVWVDPEAARRVLCPPALELCLVGLNVTRGATIDDAGLARLGACSLAGGRLAKMITGYADLGQDGWPLHDVAIVTAALEPGLLVTRPATIEVDTGAGPSRAQTVCEFDEAPAFLSLRDDPELPSRARVAVELDRKLFREMLFERIGRLG
ncbi:MAG: nucleoside hydrolase [Solirubrobacterales bacterium]